MNSIPQHDRPSGSGHTLFLRHQFAIDWSVESRNPPSVEPVAETTSVVEVAGAGLVGGAAAGGLSAFVGILASHFMGDVPVTLLSVGTAGSAVTGAIGGMVGRVLSTPSGIARSRG